MFDRIVVGVTSEQTAKEAVHRAQEVARTFAAELHVVAAFDAAGADAAADRAERLLGGLATASGTPLHLHPQPGDAAAAICGVAQEVGADLIVVGNKGLARGSRWSKSVPGEVSRTAPCSVLILDTI